MKWVDLILLAGSGCRQFLVAWIMHAFPRGQTTPLHVIRHMAIMLMLLPTGLLFLIFQWLSHFLDEFVCRDYRHIKIERPLLIVGLPRSGTTTLHHALAADTAHFSTVQFWEALLAPALFQKRIIKTIARLDQRMGGGGYRCLKRLDETLQRRNLLEGTHPFSLLQPEEDFMFLVPAMGCLALIALFPNFAPLWRLADFDTLPMTQRNRLAAFHHACLQKHMAATQNKRLLSKNASFLAWSENLRERYPDAILVCCTREQLATKRSQIHAMRPAMAIWHMSPAWQSEFDQRLENMIDSYHRRMHSTDAMYRTALMQIPLDRLQQDLTGCILDLQNACGITPDAPYREKLAALHVQAQKHRSIQPIRLKNITFPATNLVSIRTQAGRSQACQH